jgi:hypothetical protein
MKAVRLPSGATYYAQEHNALRSDAVASSWLHVHQQLGALALGTTPTNGQTVTLDINGTNVQFQAVTGSPTNSGDVKAPGTAAGFVANLFAALQNPTVTTATYVALVAANAQLVQYLGYGLATGGTTITPFSLNTSTYSPLSSFSASTTLTSGSWTAQTMELYVQPGTYYIGTTRVLFLGGSTPTFTAPVSHPRIDLVTADSSGTIALVTGTEGASPSAPAYPANKLVLAEIFHVVGETALYDVDNQQSGQGYVYNDVRPFFPGGYISSASQIGTGIVLFDPGSDAQGDIYYWTGSALARLPAGTAGNFLQTQGPGANPQWSPFTPVVAMGSKSGTPYTVPTNASPGVALDATNLKITFTGAIGQVVRITAFVAAQQIVTINQSCGISIQDTTNSVNVGTICGGSSVSNATYQLYGLIQFYYTLASTTTVFEMFAFNQSGSNTFTVYNPSSVSFSPAFGVQQNFGGSPSLAETLAATSAPWFSVEAI